MSDHHFARALALSFEQRELAQFCNERGFNVALKSVDDAGPLHSNADKGLGTIAMIWKRDIDHMFFPMSDGRTIVPEGTCDKFFLW